MTYLTEKIEFPEVDKATKEGLLAMGGDLSVERLIYAYSKGIFPWFENKEPLLWWSPDPRSVLFPEDLKISKSMAKLLERKAFNITYNRAFNDVIGNCSKINRKDQLGTWITQEMITAYTNLFNLGFAKSVEVWQNNDLVGGLYGIDLGNGVFCGESMFTKVSNASKYGFISMVTQQNYKLIDCQLHTNHLESLGAKDIPRSEFLKYLV
ncbi:MAG: leucyl/phenylalanyl-tRNA--protein transferase [Bacteroidia bacterium]|nr:leucyl/phenylalanyl-tRNA--protein transferase [Bacteroidia bacterium]NNF85439.1 leucyl/phenylalanyl-tRNA--protein transferase [Winogradskyella sp.]